MPKLTALALRRCSGVIINDIGNSGENWDANYIAGGSVAVPTLRGTKVSLTVPPDTQNGTRLRLRGLGMPHLRGSTSGDLIAEVVVRLPQPAPPALRAWAEAGG